MSYFSLSLMLWTYKLFVPVRCFQPNLSNVSKARSSFTCVGFCTIKVFITDALKYKLFFLNRYFRPWPIIAVEATNIHLSVLHLGNAPVCYLFFFTSILLCPDSEQTSNLDLESFLVKSNI